MIYRSKKNNINKVICFLIVLLGKALKKLLGKKLFNWSSCSMRAAYEQD